MHITMTLTFQEESVNVGPLPRRMSKVFSGLLGDVHSQSHLVQGPEVLPGDALQHGWRRESVTRPKTSCGRVCFVKPSVSNLIFNKDVALMQHGFF